jgi:hypothetical protein
MGIELGIVYISTGCRITEVVTGTTVKIESKALERTGYLLEEENAGVFFLACEITGGIQIILDFVYLRRDIIGTAVHYGSKGCLVLSVGLGIKLSRL